MSETQKTPATTSDSSKPRRWSPLDMMTQMQNELDRFWGSHLLMIKPLLCGGEVGDAWVPRADMFEQNGNLIVKAELPGAKKENIEVEVTDGDLVIRGERKDEQTVEEKDYYRMERTTGRFYRRLPLPEGVSAQEISATFNDGVLQVTIPKPKTVLPEPTKVAIQ